MISVSVGGRKRIQSYQPSFGISGQLFSRGFTCRLSGVLCICSYDTVTLYLTRVQIFSRLG